MDDQHPGYLLYDQTTPIGFCIKVVQDNRHDIAEFYIIPTYRTKGVMQTFAIEIFKKYSGPEIHTRQCVGVPKVVVTATN